VFLIDETGQDAVLVASTGEPGRQLLARGHRLGVGSLSVIGRVTQAGQTVIARDTSTSPVHKKNEFLPNTRAEMALPLIRGTQVLGALDVQSTEPDAFTPEDQRTFETLAAQLAVAIDNARLFTETQRRTAEVENLNRLLMRTTWQTSLAAGRRRETLVAAAGPQATDAPEEWSPWELEAIETGQLVVSPPQPDGSVTLALPIILRGERLGAVEWTLPAGGDSESTRQTAQELVARLGITLENVRLLEQTEQQAQRERLVNRISGRLMTQTSVNQILETAVRELAQVLGTSQVSIQLKRPNGAAASGSTENA
jgi:GAF domain-containing protein